MQKEEMASKPQMLPSTKDGAWVYMWIAHYSDGTSLPQYDPYILSTHTFKEVNQDKLIKFGLYPFPLSLAKRLKEEKGLNIKSNILLPKYEVDIDKNTRVIGALSTNYIQSTNYTYCPTCKKWMNKNKFRIIDIGGKVKTHICLVCDTQSYWECKYCNKIYKHIKESKGWKCHYCDRKVTGHRIQFYEDSVVERWRTYKLGYQKTINGINHKVIMEISENGNVLLTNK
jgi:hypothetical protein